MKVNIVTHTCREHRPISFNQSTIFFVFQNGLFAKVFELVDLVALTRVVVFNGFTSWLSVASHAPIQEIGYADSAMCLCTIGNVHLLKVSV